MGLAFAPDLVVKFFLGTKMFIHGGFPTCNFVMLFGLKELEPQIRG
jgi:hypothetical protein